VTGTNEALTADAIEDEERFQEEKEGEAEEDDEEHQLIFRAAGSEEVCAPQCGQASAWLCSPFSGVGICPFHSFPG
jgi:hypothetical protein